MYFPGQNPRNFQMLPQKRGQIGGRLLMAKYGIDVDRIMAHSKCYRENRQELKCSKCCGDSERQQTG